MRHREAESVRDDLDVIDLLKEEGLWTARGSEPEAGDGDPPPRRRRLLVLAIAALLVAITGVSVGVSRDDGEGEGGVGIASEERDANSEPGSRVMSSARTQPVPDVVPATTTIPLEPRPPPTTPGDASTTAPLLPEGAPSTPHIGELVVSAWPGPGPSGFSSGYNLYADGRLIWLSEGGSGEFVEQRLTPEGVERVRSEFLASGLFDPTLPGLLLSCAAPLCVRGDDGRLLSAPQSAGAEHLFSYLGTLDASLPKTEWATPRIKTYVASRFNVCLGTYANVPDRAIPVQIDLSAVLPALPTDAAELFDSREAQRGGPGPSAFCIETTLEEARALADLFLSPTGGGTHEYNGIVVRNAELAAIPSDVSQGVIPYITFQPLLPDAAPFGG